MSPSKREREREYARRRHSEWQQRQGEKTLQQRQQRRSTVVRTVAALAALAVLVVTVWAVGTAGTEDDPGVVAPTASTTPAGDPCPAPTSTAPAEPVQLETVPDPSVAQGRAWTATLATSCGDVTVELDGAAAPQAVASFVTLAQADFFAGTACHRLTTAGIFVLQCGDPTGTGQGGPGYSFGPVENAPADDVYPAGTLAMARVGGDADSMGSQFFLVYEDSTIPSDTAGGYTVFGRVTSGLDVVQRVAGAGATGGGDGAPTTPISIEQVTVQ